MSWPLLSYLASGQAWDLSCLLPFLQNSVLPALSAVGLLLLLWGAGLRLCRSLKISSEGAQFALPIALALVPLGLLFLCAGLFGRLKLGLWLGLAFLALAAIEPVIDSTSRLEGARSDFPYRKRVLLASLIYCAFHVFVSALAPAVGWDALAYHLAIPKLYLASGGVLELPWLLHSHWPHLMELLYALPLALGQETVAALLHAGLCALLVLTVFRLGREEGGATGWAAAALLAAQPVLLEVASEPHADGAVTLFHLLAGLCLWRWSQRGERGLLVAGGLCSGLAAACKLQGLALTGTLFLWLLWDKTRRKSALSFLLWALIPVLPWYAKTWYHTGNPLWPFYSKYLGGLWEPQLIDASLQRTSLWRFPRDLDLLWRYSPQCLLAPALALWGLSPQKRLPPFLLFLLLPLFPLAGLSLPYHEAWRFLLPLLPAGALACGWWYAQSWTASGWRGLAATAVLVAGLLPVLRLNQSNELFAVLALKSQQYPQLSSQDVYRARQLPFYLFYLKAAEALPPDAKVLLFREVRGYHLETDYMWGDPVISTQILYDRLSSPEALYDRLRALGVTHVLTNAGNGLYGPNESYYSPRTIALMEAMLHIHSDKLLVDGPLRLDTLR